MINHNKNIVHTYIYRPDTLRDLTLAKSWINLSESVSLRMSYSILINFFFMKYVEAPLCGAPWATTHLAHS